MASESEKQKLVKLLQTLEDTQTTIPDELTKNVLLRSGVKCDDERTLRLVSLAAGKFLEDLIDETCMIQANRSQATIKHQQNEGFPKDRKPVILTEDLSLALQRYGMRLYRPPYLEENFPRGRN
eukprot:jgi/Picsp_1/6104/NSC_03458-R1_transcription initiation factor tfiid subunit 10